MNPWWTWGAAWIAWVGAWSALLPLRARSHPVRIASGVGLAALAWIPVAGLPLLAYQRGWIGDLSVTTTLLLALSLGRRYALEFRVGAWVSGAERQSLLMLAAACAVVFYPMALGLTAFDPYRLGYGEPVMLIAVAAMAAVCWARRRMAVAAVLAVGTCGYSLGLLESTNLWDYLIDPFLCLYAIGALIGAGLRQGSKRRQSPPKRPADC